MSTQAQVDRIEEFLQDHLGDGVIAYDGGDHPYHPQAVHFSADEPDADFTGFGGKELLEVNLITDETDDDHKYRIERAGDLLIYVAYDRDSSRCTYSAGGQALVCEEGSDAESVFLANVAVDIVSEAAGPLRSVTSALRDAGITLSPTYQATLVKQLFNS